MVIPVKIEPRWWLGDQPRISIPGARGFSVFVGDSIQDVIAFLGWRDSDSPGGIKCEGTGFLFHYQGHGYVVTVRHVAEKLGRDPFVVRVNKPRGPAELIDADDVRWFYPADPVVDLAVTPANFDGPLYFPDDLVFSQGRDGPVDIGDICYTAGLFHFVAGHKRNLPFLFTGHIALLPPPGERIPVGNDKGGTDQVEGYLVENNAINGASGSPVFVRPSTALRAGEMPLNVMAARTDIFLFGIYQAAWFLPPDAVLREGIKARNSNIVPVGIGVVVPVSKLIELLETPELQEMRSKNPKVTVVPATLTGISGKGDAPLANGENPTHQEDFTRLVNAAARKPAPKD